MEAYPIWNLVINLFTAIGTCGATSLALYFWLNDKKTKLNIRAMHAEAYGNLQSVEGGFFVVNLTNTSNWPITIETVGMQAFQKTWFCQKLVAFRMFENTSLDRLPKKLAYGESYIYSEPMVEAQKRLSTLKEKNNMSISDIKLVVCVPTAKRDINFKFDKYLKSILMPNRKNHLL